MNIQFQIAGIILLVLLVILRRQQRRVRLYAGGVFRELLIAVGVCLFWDIMSIVAIYHIDVWGKNLTELVCKLYLASIPFVPYKLFSYVYLEVHQTRRYIKTFAALSFAPLLFLVLILLTFPIQIYHVEDVVYTYGVCVITTYVISIFYLFAIIGYIIYYRRQLEKSVWNAVAFLIGALMGAAFIQFMNNEILLVGLSLSISMVYMYVTLENPQVYVDRETGVYNAYAYTGYLHKKVSGESGVWLAAVKIGGTQFVHENFGVKGTRKMLENLTEFFSQNSGGRVKVFRIREEVFGLVFEKEQDMENAVAAINKRFEKPWEVYGVDIKLDSTIAYLSDKNLITKGEELADIVHYFLWEGDKQGKNTTIRIDETQLLKRTKMIEAEKALKWALENDKVEVYYQPIYNIHTGKFSSVEALARIVDENKQFMMPDIFIPLAEQNGMILELGLQVFEKTCKFIKEENLQALGIETVDINLSAVQCMQEVLAGQLLSLMEKYDIPPHIINLEITETAAVHSKGMLLGNMEALTAVGATFSLDDYGTGYTNMSYIVTLPIHTIKLDKTMVWSYFSNPKGAIATKNTIVMVKEMGLTVVAEGVENEKQYEEMKQLGVEYIQGYYFSRPLTSGKLITFLKSRGGIE